MPPTKSRFGRPSYRDLIEGRYELPLCLRPLCQLLALGHVITDRPGWHNHRYIYPAGYKVSRVYTSPIRPNEKVVWYRQIIDDGRKCRCSRSPRAAMVRPHSTDRRRLRSGHTGSNQDDENYNNGSSG
jgi:hypothetical protein